jgi:hypothetical protein
MLAGEGVALLKIGVAGCPNADLVNSNGDWALAHSHRKFGLLHGRNSMTLYDAQPTSGNSKLLEKSVGRILIHDFALTRILDKSVLPLELLWGYFAGSQPNAIPLTRPPFLGERVPVLRHDRYLRLFHYLA